MSIVALSTSIGSLGDEIGREVARALGYEFADREIIARAADRFGIDASELRHVAEEKPTLWERFVDTKQHVVAHIEATITEMAARDDVVLAGLGAAMILRGIPHALRVRVTAPEAARIARVQQQHGLTHEGATDFVHAADRERAARVRFLHHVDWDDPGLYDLVLNTERLTVLAATRVVLEALKDERYQSTPESSARLRDRAVIATARAALLSNPGTRFVRLSLQCHDGVLSASGLVDSDGVRRETEEILRRIPGVTSVRAELVTLPPRAQARSV
jgi:cytidylate kinase